MKYTLFALILASLAAATTGCYPKKPSAKCQSIIDECLKNCPNDIDGQEDNYSAAGNAVETSSSCEKTCYARCAD